MNATTLLADPAAIEIEKFISLDDEITIVVRSIQKAAICPQCDSASSSLKTRYVRRLADLPWHGVAARLEVHTRKFRCRNEICPQKKRYFANACRRSPMLMPDELHGSARC